MFVQIHMLRDYSTALPNRGQDGLAKRTVYGGIERQRISSQSFKAALRDSNSLVRQKPDGSLAPDTLQSLAQDNGLAMSVRSALIGDRVVRPELVSRGFVEDRAVAWADAIMKLWQKADKKSVKKKSASADDADDEGEVTEGEPSTAAGKEESGSAPLVVGRKEIDALVEAAAAMEAEGQEPGGLRELFEKPRVLAKAPDPVRNAVESMRALKSNAGIDGALFGRFATGVAVNNIDSAVHVAHLVTVHPLFSFADFFSAQDQLKSGDGEDRGGSHINTSELTSGLFYSYVVIDIGQLEDNFSGLDDVQRESIVAWLIRAVAQAEPAAKLGSTAPYSGLRELVVEIGRRQPRTLIGAFERPVEAGVSTSLSEEARRRLASHAEEVDSFVGKPSWRSALREHASGSLPAVEALSVAAAQQLSRLKH